jgi:hypothetical protein
MYIHTYTHARARELLFNAERLIKVSRSELFKN